MEFAYKFGVEIVTSMEVASSESLFYWKASYPYLHFRGIHAVHAHGVEAEESVELRVVDAKKSRIGGQKRSHLRHLSQRFRLFTHDQPTHDHVLQEHYLMLDERVLKLRQAVVVVVVVVVV